MMHTPASPAAQSVCAPAATSVVTWSDRSLMPGTGGKRAGAVEGVTL